MSNLQISILPHQVNAISFHPVHGTLATVGSDGRFSFWDKDARTKLKTSEQLDQPITACCFNHNGNIFAYASSYDWSKVGECKISPKVVKRCLYFTNVVHKVCLFVLVFTQNCVTVYSCSAVTDWHFESLRAMSTTTPRKRTTSS